MTIWLPDLDHFPGPRYRAIADALEAATAEGELAPGTRLPTHRELAERLGVTVGTVTRAYAEAERRGLTEGTVGRGTFIRARRTVPTVARAYREPGVIDLGLNQPTLGPHAEALAAALARLAGEPDLERLLGYDAGTTVEAHQRAAARWLAGLGLDAQPGQIVITCGARHALLAAMTALAEPGDVLLTEALGYRGIHAAAAQARLRIEPVAIDAEGLIPDALEAACRAHRPRLLACVPTLHNPTAAVMPGERRRAVAAIAREFDLLILDDDVYGFCVEDRPPPLTSFAPERSCYINNASKALAPGLRLGYAVAPPALAERIAATVRGSVWMPPPLMLEIATRWIEDGTAAQLMRWQIDESRARQALAERFLGRWPYARQPAGCHLWLPLPEPWCVGDFVAAARAQGVAVAPAEAFVVGRGAVPQAVRLSVTVPPSRDALESGLRRLAGLLESGPAPRPEVV